MKQLPRDQSSAALITVNPDGTTGADFTGHVSARGLDLPNANDPGSVAPDNRISWIPGAAPDNYATGLWAEKETVLGPTRIQRMILDIWQGAAGAVNYAELLAQVHDVSRGLTSVRVIDSRGRSDFVFNETVPGALGIIIGTDSVTGNATPLQTDQVTHNLGRTPLFAYAVVTSSTNFIATNCTARDFTHATFSFRNLDNINWSGNLNYDWIVIG